MSEDTSAGNATAAAAMPKKAKKAATEKPKTAPTHPKVSEMVTDAITSLKERGGSSLQAIKKHITSQNKVDLERLTPFIKKYLKSAVASGDLVQTKGKGASGSFKLSASGQKTKDPKAKKPIKESASPAKKTKEPKAKKPIKESASPAKKTKQPKAKKPMKESASPAKKTKVADKKVVKPKAKTPEKKKPVAKKPAAKKAAKPKSPKKAAPSKPKSPKVIKRVKTPKKAAPKKGKK